MTVRLNRALRAAAGVACLLAAGCGGGRTTVEGAVSHGGKKLAWGGVSLVASDGSAHQGTIGADGRFTIPDVPVGPAKLGVTSVDPNLGAKEPGGRRWKAPDLPPGAWFPIPDKYRDPERSGLTAEVRPGAPLQIDLP